MGYGKWLAGFMGWAVAGPIGALLGFGIGAVVDQVVNSSSLQPLDGQNIRTGQRNSFLLSLMVLSAAVMKADGKVMRSELEYVKDFIRRNFGQYAVPEALRILKNVLQKNVPVDEICAQITLNMPSSQRLQLLHYLCGLASADADASPSEKDMLRHIAYALRLTQADIDSVFAMFGGSVDDAYKVLGIDPNSSDDDVKKAYRVMAMKHHPDKVASLGDDVRRAAEEKFKSIQDAYEKIKKERGIK